MVVFGQVRELRKRARLAAGVVCFFAMPVHAQQPLEEFLLAADTQALDLREAASVYAQAGSQIDEARSRLLPNVTAQGSYTRNEFQAAFSNPLTSTQTVIQPYEALLATFSLNVPLFDFASWSALIQSEALRDAAEARHGLTHQAVRIAVAQIWHQLVASRSVLAAAQRNVDANQQSVTVVEARVSVGVSPALDLARAQAELARARQALAEATLQSRLAERNLFNLTGLHAEGDTAELSDELEPEQPLEHFLERLEQLPTLRAAFANQRIADMANDTAWTLFLPTLQGFARESGSNAAGFTGQNWAWSLGLTANWQLDFLRPAQVSTRAHGADLARVQTERVRQTLETQIYESWQRVDAARASLEAAHSGLEAATRAAQDARVRFDAGSGTQLEMIQAERDRFQAEVQRIQATATLRVARMILHFRVQI